MFMALWYLLSAPESPLESVPNIAKGNPEGDGNPEMFKDTWKRAYTSV